MGRVQVTFNAAAQTIRFRVATMAGALAPGAHQLHLHANYAGNLRIGDPMTQQVEALAPALTDDLDGDGVIEVFEAVPLIGESWWTLATVAVGADGTLRWDSGSLSTAEPNLFAPDPLDLTSPGVDIPGDIDNPTDIDNIGFDRSALDNFELLAFDIHGAPDPAGVDSTPGEVDGIASKGCVRHWPAASANSRVAASGFRLYPSRRPGRC